MAPFVYKNPLPNSGTLTLRRPLRRRFVSYTITINQRGELELVDTFEQYDYFINSYVKKEERISLPIFILEKLNSDNQPKLERLCTELRQEIDNYGLKIFFDFLPNNELRAKWRYRLRNKIQTDYLLILNEQSKDSSLVEDSDVIAANIIDLVRNNPGYHLTAEWHNWFGRKMQRKREKIIFTFLRDELT
jgi:hypothetical protein